jgi:very-short-patch-repair endonuclease
MDMPHRRTSVKTFSKARELRRNPTEAEVKLWHALRGISQDGVHFRRQHAIGRYIVDFCAPEQKLIVELDGSQHLEREVYDAERTIFLEEKGYRVLRFWNQDVMGRMEDVMRTIFDAIQSLP